MVVWAFYLTVSTTGQAGLVLKLTVELPVHGGFGVIPGLFICGFPYPEIHQTILGNKHLNAAILS